MFYWPERYNNDSKVQLAINKKKLQKLYFKEEIIIKIRRYFKLSCNENMKYQNGKNKVKWVLRGNFMDLNACKKKIKTKINDVNASSRS